MSYPSLLFKRLFLLIPRLPFLAQFGCSPVGTVAPGPGLLSCRLTSQSTVVPFSEKKETHLKNSPHFLQFIV